MPCPRRSRLPLLRHGACIGLLALAGLIGGEAQAQLGADRLVLDFDDTKVSRRDVMLSNDGSEPLYVEVGVEEILVGSGGERSTRKGTPDQLGLLVTPNRLIIEPGQRRPVRAVLLQRPATERVYQITMKPVVGELQSDAAKVPGKKTMRVKVLLGYQAIAFARPAMIKEDLQASRAGRTLRFANAGNVSMVLDSGRQCATPDLPAERCDRLPSKRVRPGAVWELPLGGDGPVTYTVQAPSGNEQKTY